MQLWEQWLAVAEQHRTDAVPATRLSVGVHEVEAWPPGAGGEIARGGLGEVARRPVTMDEGNASHRTSATSDLANRGRGRGEEVNAGSERLIFGRLPLAWLQRWVHSLQLQPAGQRLAT